MNKNNIDLFKSMNQLRKWSIYKKNFRSIRQVFKIKIIKKNF